MLSCICMLTWKYLYITVMALVGFSASAVQALTYQNGDYMGSLNKKASGAQCFIMALGLFWDIVTGLPWTPNGVGSLGPRGYCIFLPGAHYLTINSPYGADSSLNKLLLLLLRNKMDVLHCSYLCVRHRVLRSSCSLLRSTSSRTSASLHSSAVLFTHTIT